MGAKKENNFDRITEKNEAEEFYTFNSNSGALSDEHFVFTHSVNNEINARNYTGEEINKKFDRLKEHREESLSVDKVQEVTTASSTSAVAASTTVTSAIAATTTAVVVVVGGGMVVKSLTYDKPEIVYVMDVGVETDTISFSLGLGNDEEKMMNKEEIGDCNVVVELTCESYSDFVDERRVEHLGFSDHIFSGLQPDTEYTLNVYSMTFLDLEREELITPMPITTTAEEVIPEPEDNSSMSIEKEQGPFGETSIYLSFDEVETSEYFASYMLEVYDEKLEASGLYPHRVDEVERTPILTMVLKENPYIRQKINLNLLDLESTYNFVLKGMSEDPELMEQNGGEPVPIVIYDKNFNLGSVSLSPFTPSDKIYLKRNNAGASNTYETYLSVLDIEDRYDFYYNVYNVTSSGEKGDFVSFTHVGTPNLIADIAFDMSAEDEYKTYWFDVMCVSSRADDIAKHNEEHPEDIITDSGPVDAELWSEVIDLSDIYTVSQDPDEMNSALIKINDKGFDHEISIDVTASGYGFWHEYGMKLTNPNTDDYAYSSLFFIDDGSKQSFSVNDPESIYTFLQSNKNVSLEFTIMAMDDYYGDFRNIYTDEYIFDGTVTHEDNLFIQQINYTTQSSDIVTKYKGYIGVSDTSGYMDFGVRLYAASEDGQKDSYLGYQHCYNDNRSSEFQANPNDFFTFSDELTSYLASGQYFVAVIFCQSNHPEDIERYNQENPGSEVGEEDYVEAEIREDFIDMNLVSVEAGSIPTLDDVSIIVKSSYLAHDVYAYLDADEYSYWDDISMVLTNESTMDSYEAYLSIADGMGAGYYRCSDSNELYDFLSANVDTGLRLVVNATDTLVTHEGVTLYEVYDYVYNGYEEIYNGSIGLYLDTEHASNGLGYGYSTIYGLSELANEYTDFAVKLTNISTYDTYYHYVTDINATNVYMAEMDDLTDWYLIELVGRPNGSSKPVSDYDSYVAIFSEYYNLSNLQV